MEEFINANSEAVEETVETATEAATEAMTYIEGGQILAAGVGIGILTTVLVGKFVIPGIKRRVRNFLRAKHVTVVSEGKLKDEPQDEDDAEEYEEKESGENNQKK